MNGKDEKKTFKTQPARGTQDFYGASAELYRKIEETGLQTSKLYGYEEIKTPIFEFSEVFHRSLGETSDAVSKETYTFQDRGGDEITLRPEGTAGVARAFISNGLQQHLPLKYYYSGPMFRYERPQKGRFRQFHQVGVEHLGVETPTADVECIALGMQFLQRLGLSDKVSLELNTLGDTESRARHREELVQFLSQFKAELSPESQERLQKNPLRILDSKDPKDRKILEGAPALSQFLSDSSKLFFDAVQNQLTALKVGFKLNQNLVRGLDYYTHTVFEISSEHLGAQSAVLAGGRYNGLIEMLGGPAVPGVGWASGIERLMLLLEGQTPAQVENLVCVLPVSEGNLTFGLQVSQQLRQKNYSVELLESGNISKKMKRANKMNATWALIIGDDEMAAQKFTAKNLKSGEQELIGLEEFVKKPL